MGLAGLSFAAGLGAGYVDQSRYQERQNQLNRERARQDAEFQMRKDLADEALAERKQASEFRRAIGAASKDADLKQSTTLDTGDGARVYDMPSGVDSQDVASSDARQFRRNAESTGVDVAAPVVSSATTVNGKAYDSYAAGLRAAAEYNDPAAKAQRVAAAMEAFGRPDAAMDYRSRSEKFRNDMYEAQRGAVFQKGSDLIAGRNYAGFADAYNQHYKDGRRALWLPSEKGGTYVIQDEKTNAEVARIPMTGDANEDIMTWQRLVYPDKAAAAAAAAAEDARREQSKPYTLKPGEQRFRGDRMIRENTNRTSADARVETAGVGRGSPGRLGGSGAPGYADALAAAGKILDDSLKNAGTKVETPGQIGNIRATLADILSIDPTVQPEHAVAAAYAAQMDPKAVSQRYNPKTHVFDDVVATPGGAHVAVRAGTATPGNLGAIKPEEIKAQMPAIIASIAGSSKPEDQKPFIAAAFDPQAMRALVDRAIGQAKSHPNYAAATPEQRQAFAEKVELDLRSRLSWISMYAPELGRKEKPPAAQPKKAPVVASGLPLSEWRMGRPATEFN